MHYALDHNVDLARREKHAQLQLRMAKASTLCTLTAGSLIRPGDDG
jgi:hypothetical protein